MNLFSDSSLDLHMIPEALNKEFISLLNKLHMNAMSEANMHHFNNN